MTDSEERFQYKTACIAFDMFSNCDEPYFPLDADTEKFKCKKCKENYYFDLESRECVKRVNLSDNCKEYDPESDTCNECDENYFKSSNDCV